MDDPDREFQPHVLARRDYSYGEVIDWSCLSECHNTRVQGESIEGEVEEFQLNNEIINVILLINHPSTEQHLASSQLALNQRLYAAVGSPDADNPQPGSLEQGTPMPLSSLPRAQLHHDQIQAGGLPVGARVRDHVLIYQQFAVPGFHGRHKIREDLAAEIVGQSCRIECR
jgi:hypothetical protein